MKFKIIFTIGKTSLNKCVVCNQYRHRKTFILNVDYARGKTKSFTFEQFLFVAAPGEVKNNTQRTHKQYHTFLALIWVRCIAIRWELRIH